MNYDKIALKKLFDTQNLGLLSKIKPEYMKYGLAKFMLKALKGYVHKFGNIPTLEVFIAELSKAVKEDKLPAYKGYLESLEDVEASIEDTVLIESLKSQYVVLYADEKIQGLVEALEEKDIDSVKHIIGDLHSAMNVTEKTPDNILDLDYKPTRIRTIKPFIPTMVSRKLMFGGLTIVGADTGAGKSVFALNQLMYSFSEEDISCCLLNLELGQDETIARMYCNATGEEFSDVYGNEAYVEKVTAWKNEYFNKDGKQFVMKNAGYDANEIIEVIRAQAARGITLFGLDYLQLVDPVTNRQAWEELSALIKKLHQLTLDLGIVIISPVQINVDEIDEENGKINIRVRGSRELENSSTVFLFVYQSPEEKKENIARIFTMKARNAAKLTYLVSTEFNHMRFVDTGVVL
jgi:replicative DNA helicase